MRAYLDIMARRWLLLTWIVLLGCERKQALDAHTPPAAEHVVEQAAREPDEPQPSKQLHVAGAARRELAKAGSASENAPQVALAHVLRGPPLVTDLEFVPNSTKLVVTSQRGTAVVFELAEGRARELGPLLELAVDSESELGLLAVVFHPHYAENGRLFVHYNPKGEQRTRLAEFALPAARLGHEKAREKKVLIEQKQPYRNHNGGELAFGPDGKLYLGLGDGGSRNDPHENGENLTTLLGKILRLDVDGPELVPSDNPFRGQGGARAEIYAYGLRNPWKISFAPDGRLIVADVGQNRYEEIDVVARGDNLGWSTREGAHCFDPTQGCSRDGRVDPIFEYGRELGGSVTGGFVYTGTALPALRGHYVFSDFLSRRVWALALSEGAGALVLGVFEAISSASFGRDADGELYMADYGSGDVFKFVPRAAR